MSNINPFRPNTGALSDVASKGADAAGPMGGAAGAQIEGVTASRSAAAGSPIVDGLIDSVRGDGSVTDSLRGTASADFGLPSDLLKMEEVQNQMERTNQAAKAASNAQKAANDQAADVPNLKA